MTAFRRPGRGQQTRRPRSDHHDFPCRFGHVRFRFYLDPVSEEASSWIT